MKIRTAIIGQLIILILAGINRSAIASELPNEINSISPVKEDNQQNFQLISQATTEEKPIKITPLSNQQFALPTAEQLLQGDIVFKFTNRLFFPPGGVEDSGTAAYPDVGFSWGITDDLQLTFAVQLVDSGSPGTQGEFDVNRKPNQDASFAELTLELQQKFWKNESRTQNLSGLVSLSFGNRGYKFVKDGATVDQGENSNVIPSLALPFTFSVQDRWRFTISPTIAFFPEESGMYIHTAPIKNPGSFGTTFGFSGGISYQVSERITLWGDAFVPVTGNNSISRETGKTAQTIAFNAGLRYLVNPRVGLDLFASNTYGNTGAMALTADRNFTAFGASLVFMPNFFGSNSRYADTFDTESKEDTKVTAAGIGFFDGGTVPNGQFILSLQGGSQGIMSVLRYGILRDLELGVYIDYISGDVDESEQGLSGKIRLLNQDAGSPITLSLSGTLSQTNQPFVNFINDNKKEFQESNLDKELPFVFDTDSKQQGKLFIVTLSLPLDYQFDNGISLWFTPTWGYVQRMGTEIAGFNVGGSVPVFSNFSVIGEVGANFAGDGNAFIGNKLENVIPWTAAIRWSPSQKTDINPLQVELYFTNRVGSSTWQQLRVRDQNETAVGVGLSIPF